MASSRAAKLHEMVASFHATAQAEHQKAMEGEQKGSRHDFHKTMAEVHGAHHQAHCDEMEACAKADSADLAKRGSQLVPTEVSAVAPTHRAVPNFGQRHLAAGATIDFTKALGLDAESMHGEEASLRE